MTVLQRPIAKCFVFPTGDPADRLDIGEIVVGFRAGRGVTGGDAEFTIDLLPRTSLDSTVADYRTVPFLYKAIRPMNVISLGVDEEGGIVLGFVKSIRRTTTYRGKQAGLGLRLICRDVAYAMTQDEVVHAYVAATKGDVQAADFVDRIVAVFGEDHPLTLWFIQAASAEDRDRPPFIADSVESTLTWILTHAPSMQIPLFRTIFGGEGSLGDFMDTGLSVTTWNDARVFSNTLGEYTGNFWQYMSRVIDPDFYEMWVDYRPADTALPEILLIIRPKPFDEPILERTPLAEDPGITWISLRTMLDDLQYHEIEREEVFHEDIGRSDDSVAAFYLVTSTTQLIGSQLGERQGLSFPLFDTWAAKNFGMRSYRAGLALLAGDVDAKIAGTIDLEQVRSDVHIFRDRLFNWHWAQSWFEEGSISVAGRDRYRPGDPVLLPWVTPAVGDEIGMRYYCPHVTWAWKFGEPYICQLRLVRGHNDGVIRAALEEIEADAPAGNPEHFAAV